MVDSISIVVTKKITHWMGRMVISFNLEIAFWSLIIKRHIYRYMRRRCLNIVMDSKQFVLLFIKSKAFPNLNRCITALPCVYAHLFGRLTSNELKFALLECIFCINDNPELRTFQCVYIYINISVWIRDYVRNAN